MENYISDAHIHDGHRARMRSKLLKHGQEIFDTYELLEMLLYHVIPYKDTNPIAKRLLYAFGGLDGALRAGKDELMTVSGIGEQAAEFIGLVGRLDSIIGAEITSEGEDCFSSYESVGEFFVDFFRNDKKPTVGAMFLDSSMRLLSAKRLYSLDYESGGVKAKAFIDAAIKCRASVVISAHSHPFGPFYPSPGDRASNNSVTSALNMAGLVHAEHYLVSGRKYAGIGSIKNFTSRLSQMPMLTEFLNSKKVLTDSKMVASAVSSDDFDAERVIENGYYNIRDLEYFAKLLSYSVGKGSDKTASDVLIKYRTIENTLSASEGQLISYTSEKCAFYLKILAYVTARRNMERFAFDKKHTKAEIADYLKALFLGQSVEKTYIISFSEDGRVIGCDLLGEGTVNASEILPRKAIEAAINRGAVAVSIAHNHPGGVPRPSADDISLTSALTEIFSSCDIKMMEHYIIAGQLCEIMNMAEDR